MKNRKWLVSAMAVAMIFTAQPVYAAGTDIQAYGSPVVTVGRGPSDGNTNVSGNTNPGGTPGSSVSGMSAPGSSGPGNGGPGSTAPGGAQTPGSSQTPPGDEGTSLSPVLTAGGGQNSQQQAAAEAAAQQAAAEAAAQQQAAAEAAAQQQAAAEAAAQQQAAAEAAAQQAAAEAAAQQAAAEAAAQQSGGRTIDPTKPMVALTFDDGPQPSVGNRIMDCLAQYGGRATFFMVGDRVAARKTEVQRMVREGHEVANHTMNHKYLQKLGAAEIQAQVTKCNDAIEAACGVRPKLMRLPGGNHNSTVVANTHMPMIQWNIDTLDWKTKNADKTVAAVLDHVKDGDIVLMHELYSQSGDAALRIIPELHRRGFQMVTVSEMAAAKGHTLQAGKLYSSFR